MQLFDRYAISKLSKMFLSTRVRRVLFYMRKLMFRFDILCVHSNVVVDVYCACGALLEETFELTF